MLEDVADDERQVFLGHQFLLVTQFDDALSNALGLFGRKFQPQFLKVTEDVGLAGVLAKGIFAFATESLWQQGILIESRLVVAIGMHPCHLREDALARDGLVGRYGYAAVALHQA